VDFDTFINMYGWMNVLMDEGMDGQRFGKTDLKPFGMRFGIDELG
jgi:hypothetical protein